MKYKLTLIALAAIFILSCNNRSQKEANSTNQKENIKNDLIDQEKDNKSSTLELLQGKWQHVSDATNFIIFEDNHRKEIAGGMDEWDDEIFVLSSRCLNDSDKENGIGPENDKFISCMESDLCWYIIEVSKEKLMLSYLASGNTLSYKKVE